MTQANAVAYPMFPKIPMGQIAEVKVWRNTAGRKAKTPDWERFWPTYPWDIGMTELQFSKLVGGGHYEIRAYGQPEEQQYQGTKTLKYHGACRENPPTEEQQSALQAPTVHESAQRAIVTVPGLSPELNAVLSSYQIQSTNYREDAQKWAAAVLELLQVYSQRERQTTFHEKVIDDLREQNRKLAESHEKVMQALQDTQLEGVELEQRGKGKHGLAGVAVEMLASRVPDVLKGVAENAIKELLGKPEYVGEVAKIHAQMMAQSGNGATE